MEQYKDVIIRVDNIREDFPCIVSYNVYKLYLEYKRDANSPDPEYDDYDDFCYVLCERFKRFIKKHGVEVTEQSLKECRKLAQECYGKNAHKYIIYCRFNDSHEFIHLNNEGIVSTNNNFFFFHMVPKGTDISDGLLSPAAMSKLGMRAELKKSLDKYRERMVKGWRIYPEKLPEELDETELIQGLEKFRGNGGSRTIYFFRYSPTKILGKNMSDILKEKDIYRINLNDPKLQDYIERIDWGYYGSYTDNKALTRDYYENISEKEYFSEYNDNPSNGTPLFASIPHIGIVFKDGICPKQFLSLITKSSDVAVESFATEMLPGDTIPDEIYMVLTLSELARLEAIHNIISSWLGYDIYPELQIIE